MFSKADEYVEPPSSRSVKLHHKAPVTVTRPESALLLISPVGKDWRRGWPQGMGMWHDDGYLIGTIYKASCGNPVMKVGGLGCVRMLAIRLCSLLY